MRYRKYIRKEEEILGFSAFRLLLVHLTPEYSKGDKLVHALMKLHHMSHYTTKHFPKSWKVYITNSTVSDTHFQNFMIFLKKEWTTLLNMVCICFHNLLIIYFHNLLIIWFSFFVNLKRVSLCIL